MANAQDAYGNGPKTRLRAISIDFDDARGLGEGLRDLWEGLWAMPGLVGFGRTFGKFMKIPKFWKCFKSCEIVGTPRRSDKKCIFERFGRRQRAPAEAAPLRPATPSGVANDLIDEEWR